MLAAPSLEIVADVPLEPHIELQPHDVSHELPGKVVGKLRADAIEKHRDIAIQSGVRHRINTTRKRIVHSAPQAEVPRTYTAQLGDANICGV